MVHMSEFFWVGNHPGLTFIQGPSIGYGFSKQPGKAVEWDMTNKPTSGAPEF